jgi:acetyltransferase-like isoleucine patch superfamily enzyme
LFKFINKGSAFNLGEPHILDFGNDVTITFGKCCTIALNLTILAGGEHFVKRPTTMPFHATDSYSKGDITIGNDVWIGYGVTILSGVTIGDGAVIGACSVVTNDVEPYAIVAGNPAKFIRYRFSPEKIKYLLELRWWDKSPEEIEKLKSFLMSEY